ncbi:hypothetical protein LOC54_00670 [Acetobacter sp. AN02]|uniref:hypothetical protein n=1 Tax=Acetobacter sp. AN02 TaxID=2894186 RepID=UPI0024342937|nr:hypothetical protein [Acetobacter sp. AN02]MDG6093638.1 hypothetical protein [Acetobacter sp. AN02]
MRSRRVIPASLRDSRVPSDTWAAPWKARCLRQATLFLTSGARLMVDLEVRTRVYHGDVFLLDSGQIVAVQARPEYLLRIRDASEDTVAELRAGRIPSSLREDGLYVPADDLSAFAIRRAGIRAEEVFAVFEADMGNEEIRDDL